MDFDTLEYGIVLVGWVVGILLGTILLFVKLPADKVHFTYRRAKNTCAITIILFGLEILFQWLIRFYFELNDPALSVSVYLMTFCVATLIFTGGFTYTVLRHSHRLCNPAGHHVHLDLQVCLHLPPCHQGSENLLR